MGMVGVHGLDGVLAFLFIFKRGTEIVNLT